MLPLPTVFAYDNYRTFLKDLYKALKLRDKKFSFRYFARVAGFNSHNFLRMVMLEKGNLSEQSIEKFSTAFKFNKEEALFFKNLVLFNQATTHEEKQAYANEMIRSKTYRKIHPLSESQYQYFKHWYFTAVRELVALPGFREDPQWICKRIVPAITASEAERAIIELLKLGLLTRNENGKLTRSESLFVTPDEVTSTYVSNWHREYLKKAAESIDTVKREERDISAVYLAFTKENLRALKDLIHKFREDVLSLEAMQEKPNAVYQLNLQLFPVAMLEEEEES